MTGLEDGFDMQVIIIVVTITIAYSVYRGMDDGIRVLSNINMSLALILVTFVLLVGPTRFILEMAIVSIGHITSNFVRMMTWADPL
jgi:BCCT family betaine/carnitine transporter